MLREKVSLPVDVRRSETPLLKFPFLCGEEAGEKGKESALSIFSRIAIFIGIPSGSLCGGERSQCENSLRGGRSKGKGKGIRTQANSKMIHASSLRAMVSRSQGSSQVLGSQGTKTKMESLCCLQFFAFVLVLIAILYRVLRLPRPEPNIAKSFLRNDKSESAIVAHRGGAAEAPENTLAAFRMSKENGAIGVEFDVDFTRDGRAVVIHDSTVDRTTDGIGLVSDFSFEEIRRLDASCKHPLRYGKNLKNVSLHVCSLIIKGSVYKEQGVTLVLGLP